MRIARALAVFACVAFVAGCAPGADESGWEVAQKRSDEARMPSFPELPVVLPPTSEAPPAPTESSGMHAVFTRKLAEGSLFRRGYSAPTP